MVRGDLSNDDHGGIEGQSRAESVGGRNDVSGEGYFSRLRVPLWQGHMIH